MIVPYPFVGVPQGNHIIHSRHLPFLHPNNPPVVVVEVVAVVVLLRAVVVVVDWVEEVPGSAGIAFRFCMVLHGFAEGSSAKDATNNHLQSTKSEVVFVFFVYQ